MSENIYANRIIYIANAVNTKTGITALLQIRVECDAIGCYLFFPYVVLWALLRE